MWRRVLPVLAAALGVAAITAVVFLIRAGDPGSGGWPVTFELRSSDNGVLFQFAQDVFRGRALDWSFSPQVFVFPEIPVSLLAFLLAGGTIQLYYLAVAVLNGVLLFLALFGVVRYLYPAETLARRLARAGVAQFPLLFLPLLGTTWLFEYALAPTYYIGMYLLILVAPILFLARSRGWRIALAICVALTAASNPLALVFVVPAFVCALVVSASRSGPRSLRRPCALAGGVLALALVIRLAFFGRLQGASPLDYVSTSIFTQRLGVVVAYVRTLLSNPVSAIVVVVGAALAVAGLVVATVIAVRGIRRRWQTPRAFADSLPAVAVYYALVPIAGLAGTVLLVITDYLYLWPVLILPLVLVVLPLPSRWVPVTAGVAAVALAVTGAVTGGAMNLAHDSRYFAYRSAETRCLDASLPAGMTVGYATFSDARRIELTSHRGIRLIQLKSSGVRAYWLTNRDYATDNVGQFFYINEHGDEPAINVGYLERHFGDPDAEFSCGPGETVLIYTEPSKLAAIKARYSTLPAP
jgi:hypothetical protein